MKKIFIPIALVLFLISCKGTDKSSTSNDKNNEGKLSACECADIFDNNPTRVKNEDITEEEREANKEKWKTMWEPCTHFDGDMTEVLKCSKNK